MRLLVAPNWKCGRCGKNYTAADRKQWLNTYAELSSKILRLFKLHRAWQAHELLPQFVEFLQYHTCPPNGELCRMQDIFTKILAIILYYAQE